MKPSAFPLVLAHRPHVGDLHPSSKQWHAVNVRLLESSDIEGKIVYAGPHHERVVVAFVLKPAA